MNAQVVYSLLEYFKKNPKYEEKSIRLLRFLYDDVYIWLCLISIYLSGANKSKVINIWYIMASIYTVSPEKKMS